MKKADLNAAERREDQSELDKMQKRLDDKDLEVEKYKGLYWGLYEKIVAEKLVIIGSPMEIEQQQHALNTYKATVEADVGQGSEVSGEKKVRTYLEVDDVPDKSQTLRRE